MLMPNGDGWGCFHDHVTCVLFGYQILVSCVLLIYLDFLFLFWLVMVAVSNFEAEFCLGSKSGCVEVFGCCSGCLCHLCLSCVNFG